MDTDIEVRVSKLMPPLLLIVTLSTVVRSLGTDWNPDILLAERGCGVPSDFKRFAYLSRTV